MECREEANEVFQKRGIKSIKHAIQFFPKGRGMAHLCIALFFAFAFCQYVHNQFVCLCREARRAVMASVGR